MASHGTSQIYVFIYLAIFILAVSWQTLVNCQVEDEYNSESYDELMGANVKRHLGSVAAGGGRGFGFTNSRVNYINPNSNGYNEDSDTMKFKRFLGTLARGGWFPRQFRGYVHPGALSYHQKRHIGAVARLGWLPYKSKEENSI